MSEFKDNRYFMKSWFNKEFETDFQRGIEQPELVKSIPDNAIVIDLPQVDEDIIKEKNIYNCIKNRRSHRLYTGDEISKEELSYLLWATQGVDEVIKDKSTMRTLPSAGARHPFETYLAINSVQGIKKGIYRYLPIEHGLLLIKEDEDINLKIKDIAMNRDYIKNASVSFMWACNPYRTEWRYGINAHRVMMLDAGHIGQSLYMACESLGLGVCTLGSYDQVRMDQLLEIDGEEEYTVYMAPVGVIE